MYTTEGSTRLAISVNSFDTLAAAGITNGVASGAAWLSLAATEVLTKVPIRTQTESVKTSRLVEKIFCCFNFANICANSSKADIH